MDEETVAVLKNSQFAQDFLIRPIEKLPTCGGCTSLAAKDTITDPSKVGYKYKVQSPPTVAGCCPKEKLLKQQLTRRQLQCTQFKVATIQVISSDEGLEVVVLDSTAIESYKRRKHPSHLSSSKSRLAGDGSWDPL